MTKLSVNINKIALIRNSRGGNQPDIIQMAVLCEHSGADGITVHPRPDERHVRYSDLQPLKNAISTEFNVEGNPLEPKFMEMVLKVQPHQVTLVPDGSGQLTSDHGWNTIEHQSYLQETIALLKAAGIRTSIFVDPIPEMIVAAKTTGTDRIELYTEAYAANYSISKEMAVEKYTDAAKVAFTLGLGINAGHDLNRTNLQYFKQQVPGLLEVSIGHALVSDALLLGLENTVGIYKRLLQ